MTTKTRGLAALALGLLLGGWHAAAAADPPATTITIPDLDCASCAKKVGGKVAEVPGVGKVEYSVQAKTLTVTPKAGAVPSPKALWESVEKAGKAPSRLAGPGGTFTAKPKS